GGGCGTFFFQAEDGIRGRTVTGVQTCALPIWLSRKNTFSATIAALRSFSTSRTFQRSAATHTLWRAAQPAPDRFPGGRWSGRPRDRKSTRLNSSHRTISYAVFCLKKKKKET